MTGLDTRGIVRLTNSLDPIKRRKPLVVRLEVGGRMLAIKLKGERRWLRITFEEIYRTAFRLAVYAAKKERDAAFGRQAGGAAREEAMKILCAWCGDLIRGEPTDPEVSHGICPRCKTEFLEREGLDSEDDPRTDGEAVFNAL
jgi:hypothetical protein